MEKNSQWIWKPCLIAIVFILLGLPILSIWKTLFCFFAIVLILSLNKLPTSAWLVKHPLRICGILLLLFFVKWALPVVNIDSGYNLYLPPVTQKLPPYRELPLAVQNFMFRHFLKFYSTNEWIPSSQLLQWYTTTRPNQTYAFSVESIWQPTQASVVVHEINFQSLLDLRQGFLNNMTESLGDFNWVNNAAHPSREEVPYFITYKFPSILAGSQICWQGTVFWNDQFITHNVMECQYIRIPQIQQKMYAMSFPGFMPLAMQLKLNGWLNLCDELRNLMTIIAVSLLLISLKPRFSLCAKILVFTALGLLQIQVFAHDKPLYAFRHFADTFILQAGGDGLSYSAYGREIFYNFLHGNFFQAFRGHDDIFYFMPGKRYFDALAFLIFGESSLMSLFLILTLVFVLYEYLNRLTNGYKLLICILLTVAGFREYFHLAITGMPESVAYPCFLLALLLLVDSSKNSVNKSYIFVSSILLAVSVMQRPNMLICCGIILLMIYYYLYKEKEYKKILISMIGFTPVCLMAIHNFYYGHKFVPFVSSAFIKENFTASPKIYWLALMGQPQSIEAVSMQINSWFPSWILVVIFMFTIGILWKTSRFDLRLMALSAISLQMPNIFWHPTSRYLLLAWTLSILLCVIYSLSRKTKTMYAVNLRAHHITS